MKFAWRKKCKGKSRRKGEKNHDPPFSFLAKLDKKLSHSAHIFCREAMMMIDSSGGAGSMQ